MKARILFLSVLVIVGGVAVGLRPPPKDQCRLSLKAAFQSEDEQVWHLTIETQEPARYRIVSGFVGGSGGFGGDTARAQPKGGDAEDGVWLVFSLVIPSGDGPAYLKTILKSRQGSSRQTRQVPRETRLGKIVASHLIGEPGVHPLNTPVVLAEIDSQRVRLLVGEKADQLDAELGGPPNAAPPRR